MANIIKVEWNAEAIQDIVHDWLGESVSKAEAEKIIKKIKADAEETISMRGYTVIINLLERL